MKKPALRCALFMALYYGANAVYQGYISKFYQQSGISGSRLILLLVSFPLLSILSQPLWGWASDRMPRRNVALLITVGASSPHSGAASGAGSKSKQRSNRKAASASSTACA